MIVWFLIFELHPFVFTSEIKHDEAYGGIGVLKLINNVNSNNDIDILGRHLPLTSTCTHGAIELYMIAPFVYFKGPTLKALRIAPIIGGVLILILTFFLTSKFFNSTVGTLSVVLLASNYFFLNIVKIGTYFGFSIPIFTLTSLLLFFKFYDTTKNSPSKNLYFYLGMFVLGLGFNTKGYYIWVLISFWISVSFLYLSYRKFRFKTFFLGLFSCILGGTPIIYYYFKNTYF